MNTPNLDNLKSVRNPDPLQYAILLYGDEQSASLEDLLDAERAAAKLTAMQTRIEKLEAALKEIDDTLSGDFPVTRLVKEIAKEALKGE